MIVLWLWLLRLTDPLWIGVIVAGGFGVMLLALYWISYWLSGDATPTSDSEEEDK